MARHLAWLLALGLCAGAQAAAQVVDGAGRRVDFAAPPARIVSLLPSLTETVCALGACDRLVGVDRYSNWPPAVRELPDVGGGLDPNVEAVVALKPDVVLIGTSSRASERLRALGIKVVALEPKTRAAMHHATRVLGELLQAGSADALLREIDAGVQAAADGMPAAARGQRVYYEVTPAPHAAGRGTFIDELMRSLGLVNIIGTALGPYPQINPELVVREDPDLIMASEQGAHELARRPGWARLRALRPGRLCAFSAAERDILVRPGPRMAEAARLMAQCAARRFTIKNDAGRG